MKRTIILLSIGLGLFLIQVGPSAARAQGNKFQAGIQTGTFVPVESQIQGFNEVDYSNGSPVNAAAGGFGNGSGLSAYGTYFFSSWGVKLTTGIRTFDNSLTTSLAPNGNTYSDDNKLTVVLVRLTLLDRLTLPNSDFTPYCGMGVGFLNAMWEQEEFPQPGIARTWLRGSTNMPDWHFVTGFTFPMYHDIIFNGEMEYCFEPANWKIRNVDTGDVTKLNNLNIGGASMKVGLAYQF